MLQFLIGKKWYSLQWTGNQRHIEVRGNFTLINFLLKALLRVYGKEHLMGKTYFVFRCLSRTGSNNPIFIE